MEKLKKRKDLTSGPIVPQILLFALPMMATAVLQLLFNTADTIVVGRWGGDTPAECERALAAVGSCSSLINLFVNLFLGLSVGAGICVAHDIGAKDEDGVRRTVHTAVITALGAGALVTLLGFSFAKDALLLMGTDESVLPEATKYIYAYFCGMPANMLYNYCASILRSKGDTVRPLIFLSVAGVANVVFNLFAVLVLRWGAMGVGVATAISQWISCILIVIYMMRMEGPCRLEPRALRLNTRKFRRMITIGLPAGLQSALFSISNVLIQSSVNSFGPTIVAANTAAANIEAYTYAVQNTLHHAAMTFVAQNLGARKYTRMKHAILHCLWIATAVGLLFGISTYVFSDTLIGIFAPGNANVVKFGMVRTFLFGLTYFLCGIMEVGSASLRAIGKSFVSMIVSLVGSCALRIVWIFAVFRTLPVEPTEENTVFRLLMLYISYPVTWIITSAVLFLMFAICFKKIRQNQFEIQIGRAHV